MQTFEELSDIFSDHNNYLTSRELLMRVSSGCSFYVISEGTVKLLIIAFNIICKNPSFKVCFFVFVLFALQEGTSKFASLESCAKEHQKRTHKRLQLQKEMVRLLYFTDPTLASLNH